MTSNSIELLSNIVVYNKYAKHLPKKKRRETWEEIINRYITMMFNKYALEGDKKYFKEIYDRNWLEQGVETHLSDLTDEDILGFTDFGAELLENAKFLYDKRVLPSMRAVQFAGPAIEKNEARIYNCGYMPSEEYRAFNELMFLLLGGTGVGFSVQFHHVDNLPEIQKPNREGKYLIGDSIEGWADAVKQLMKAYFGLTKTKPRFDFSDIREKGTALITAGGKAPGPEPLKRCLTKIEELLQLKKSGEKLTTLDVHDIQCHIADAVLAGGIRRAALISLFSMDDKLMLNAKSSAIPTKLISKEFARHIKGSGLVTDPTRMLITIEQAGRVYKNIELIADAEGKFWDLSQIESEGTAGWWVANPQRGRANNSAVILRNRVQKGEFDTLWQTVVESNSGEPGVYFTNDPEYGTNPCCEISLRPYTFCNLTEINAGNITSLADYKERIRVAAFFGTLQAGFTDFHYLRSVWKKNTEKDALIGVGKTGIANGLITYDLSTGADIALEENARVAKLIGINEAARVTTIKPSGTTSCVVGTSSGIHAWHDKFYIRNMQCRVGDDLYNFFTKYHPKLIKVMERDPNSAVIGIPQKAPETAILRDQESALDLLERVKDYNLNWVRKGHRRGPNTNNVSATISVQGDEWDTVGAWMWKNRDTFNGLSVLPYDGGSYKDAPFMTIDEAKYNGLMEYIKGNPIDLTKIVEDVDNTDLTGEVACGADGCIVY